MRAAIARLRAGNLGELRIDEHRRCALLGKKRIELEANHFGAELARFGFVSLHERLHYGALLDREREPVGQLERAHRSGVLIELRRLSSALSRSPCPRQRGTERFPRPRVP